MHDMIVNLYDLQYNSQLIHILQSKGINIRRAFPADMLEIIEWVKNNFSPYAAGECSVCFSNKPVSCFLAEKDGNILGFACYNASYKAFFGPMFVVDEYKGMGIGKALLIESLLALKNEGYAYGIIGGVGPAEFYKKTVNARDIENSTPGIYKDFLQYIRNNFK